MRMHCFCPTILIAIFLTVCHRNYIFVEDFYFNWLIISIEFDEVVIAKNDNITSLWPCQDIYFFLAV